MTFLEPKPGRRARLGAGRLFGIVLAVLLNLALIASIFWLGTHRDRVSDQFAVWNFTPAAAIAEYAARSTMTEEGRFLFYASRPSIASGTEFDAACATHQEGVGILGCYLPADRSIHLFDVTDPRLDGLEEVVAAHEMLHAAWDRMSADERAKLAPLLEAEVAKLSDDTTLAETLAFYATAEPGERLNELHSILGTEYSNLSPQLEAHYAEYFTDRKAITAMHDTSNAVFVDQAAQVTALIAQIDALAAGIDTDYAAYNTGYDQLTADVQSFNSRAEAGGFDSQAAFDQERQALISRQADLDALYGSIQERHDTYTGLLAQLDALNAQADQLNQSINITPHDSTGVNPG
ncbi:MAG: hypothetical protein JWP19_800 [Rhodoglobus sp.]|nr:hypothetical protein [Rhodoglobus sp.]